MTREARNPKQERHHDRASIFYKMVLRWQKDNHGGHGRNSRQAAIGLPVAVRAGATHAHVRQFIIGALRDGMPLEKVEAVLRDFERLKDGR